MLSRRRKEQRKQFKLQLRVLYIDTITIPILNNQPCPIPDDYWGAVFVSAVFIFIFYIVYVITYSTDYVLQLITYVY